MAFISYTLQALCPRQQRSWYRQKHMLSRQTVEAVWMQRSTEIVVLKMTNLGIVYCPYSVRPQKCVLFVSEGENYIMRSFKIWSPWPGISTVIKSLPKPQPWAIWGKFIYVRVEVSMVAMKSTIFWNIRTQFVAHRRHITSRLQSPAS
jgi:hypothetical protein